MGGVSTIDYIISHHTEQDHSGTIPQILKKYPEAKLISTPKAKGMLIEPVLTKGLPSETDFSALENLAETIATKHKEHGFK